MQESFEQSASSFLDMLRPLTSDDRAIIREIEIPQLQPGTIVRVAGEDCIVLASHSDGTSALVTKNLIETTAFGESANWAISSIRESLGRDFAFRLLDDVGTDNIVRFRRNLIAMDGATDFGTCEDVVSIMSLDEYRQYGSVLDAYNPGRWWWLLTPWSTPARGWSRSVCCVRDDGAVCYGDCDFRHGVRPFFLLKSEILTS